MISRFLCAGIHDRDQHGWFVSAPQGLQSKLEDPNPWLALGDLLRRWVGRLAPHPMDLSMGLPECLRMLNRLPYLPQSHTQFSSLLLVTEASPIHWGGCTQRWEHLDTEVIGYWLPQTLLLLIPQSKLVIWRFFRNNYDFRILLLLWNAWKQSKEKC